MDRLWVDGEDGGAKAAVQVTGRAINRRRSGASPPGQSQRPNLPWRSAGEGAASASGVR